MEILGILLLILGIVVAVVGHIWLLILAFRENVLWGLAVFFIGGLASILFAILNWAEAKKPFLLQIAALPVLGLGFMLTASLGNSSLDEEFNTAGSETVMDQAIPPGAETESAPAAEPLPPSSDDVPPPAQAATLPPQTQAQAPPLTGPPSQSARSIRTATPPAAAVRAAPAPLPVEPSTPPEAAPVLSNAREPVQLTVLQILDRDQILRKLVLRITNSTPLDVFALKMNLVYLNQQGARVGQWTTIRSEDTPIVRANSSAEFTHPAYQMPAYTKNVRVNLQEVKFSQGAVWPVRN